MMHCSGEPWFLAQDLIRIDLLFQTTIGLEDKTPGTELLLSLLLLLLLIFQFYNIIQYNSG